jgi:hypothetical protein
VANEYVYFYLRQTGADESVTPNEVFSSGDRVEARTGSSGDISVDLWVNDESGIESLLMVTTKTNKIDPSLVIIPSSAIGGTIDIADLLINHQAESSPQQSTVLDASKAYTDSELESFAADPSYVATFAQVPWRTGMDVYSIAEVDALIGGGGVDLSDFAEDPTSNGSFNATNWKSGLGLSPTDNVEFGQLEISTLTLSGTPVTGIVTTTTDDDSVIPTSGAVVDAIAAANLVISNELDEFAGDPTYLAAFDPVAWRTDLDVYTTSEVDALISGGGAELNGFAADPSSNGSFNSANWVSDLSLSSTDSPTFDGLTLTSSLSLSGDSVSDIESVITDTDSALPTSGAVVDYNALNRAVTQIIVKQASDLSGTLDSTKVYVIDGIIDMGSQTIEVPSGGLSIIGSTFDVSQLTSSANTYDMFTSPVGGSGNLVIKDVGITTSGTGSSVFALTDATGFNAIEIKVVNFNNCTSLGYLDGYRQGLESGTGRFGGTPELEFRSAWVGGYRTETTIARGMSNFTSLFKAGAGFTYDGRVILGMNCDLPATGAFCDFAASNIDNDESLQLSDCRVTRAGVLDASDTTIYPNIDHTNVKCLWTDNAGLPNTTKYIKGNITTEVTTVVSATNTYYPLAGTFTVETSSHLDMPSNGEFRLLSGNGTYQILGDFVIDGSANDVVDMRVTKSTDGGATWPTEVIHIRRQINSLVGGRDVAFFPINFIATLQEDDRVRLEIENTTSTSNLTAELDSYLIVTAI